jgi:transposase
LRRPHRPPGRDRPGLAPPLQRRRPRLPRLSAFRRTRPLFTPSQVERIVDAVENSEPQKHGLPGHLWTVKKLRQWLAQAFGLRASRNAIRRALKRARLSFKKIKKLLGEAKPDKRAAHVEQLSQLFDKVRAGEIILVYIDEAHFHRDMDLGYGWGRIGKRIWRKSGCAKLSERLNCYGAYDFSNGECFLWEDGWCDGERTVEFLRELKRWREGKAGELVVIWDNAPCHTAKVVKAEAARLGVELIYLPGYSPDLNPIERLWDWMRQEVTRGHCHPSVAGLTAACQEFIATINQNPIAVVDRLWPVFELDPEVEDKLRVSS